MPPNELLPHLAGFHAVTARLRTAPETVREVYVDARRQDQRLLALVERARAAHIVVHTIDSPRLDRMAAGSSHQGVVALIDPPLAMRTLDDIFGALREPALLLVLDGVTDPHNLGACLRSADAFGAHAVIVPKDRAAGLTSVVAKAASGAAETVPLIAVTNLARTLRALKERRVWIIGADTDGDEALGAADLSGPLAWVLGAEGSGLRRLTRESCDRLIGIPLLGTVPSLNVSVSTGICLFETRRQRNSATARPQP